MTPKPAATPPSAPEPDASHEVELKFILPVAAIESLADQGLDWPDATPPQHTPLISIYYDTPDYQFWHHGIALRIRRQGNQWLQHLKWRGRADAGRDGVSLAGGSIRTEWEWSRPDSEPDTGVMAAALDGAIPLPKGWAAQIKPVFETQIIRTAQILTIGRHSQVEAAYDRGVLRTTSQEQGLAEVELELVKGRPLALYQVAEQLVTITGARLAGGSKAAQGYRLATAQALRAKKAKRARLNKAQTGHQALQAQAARTLRGLLDNQQVLLGHQAAGNGADNATNDPHYDPKATHQMRVALRRLDAIMHPLAPALTDPVLTSPAITALIADARWVRQTLGTMRNWDVFLSDTLPQTQSSKDAHYITSGTALLRPVAEALRQAAQARVRHMLTDTRYAMFLLRLAQLADGAAPFNRWPSASRAVLDRPYRHLAARWFVEYMMAIDGRGQKLHRLKPTKQHRFRLQVKKARYVAEIIASIERSEPLKIATKQMAKLQDALGAQNDAFTALELLDEMAKHPLVIDNVSAEEAIARKAQRLHQQCAAANPKLTTRWQQITQDTDQWLVAKR
ncbi:MAG: CYTH and CHAD domain-containing protein [Pseudomonadota bacterium]